MLSTVGEKEKFTGPELLSRQRARACNIIILLNITTDTCRLVRISTGLTSDGEGCAAVGPRIEDVPLLLRTCRVCRGRAMSIFGYFIRCIVFVIDLVNPLNLIDLLFRLLYRKSSAGRLKGHEGTVVSIIFIRFNSVCSCTDMLGAMIRSQRGIALSRDGSLAVSASGDHTLRVW
jgi:hypothetical protein